MGLTLLLLPFRGSWKSAPEAAVAGAGAACEGPGCCFDSDLAAVADLAPPAAETAADLAS